MVAVVDRFCRQFLRWAFGGPVSKTPQGEWNAINGRWCGEGVLTSLLCIRDESKR
jgi:hypothetical protein